MINKVLPSQSKFEFSVEKPLQPQVQDMQCSGNHRCVSWEESHSAWEKSLLKPNSTLPSMPGKRLYCNVNVFNIWSVWIMAFCIYFLSSSVSCLLQSYLSSSNMQNCVQRILSISFWFSYQNIQHLLTLKPIVTERVLSFPSQPAYHQHNSHGNCTEMRCC